METGKTIGNVNVLDLRKATAESVSGIHQIGNVNLVLFSPETAPLVTSLNIGNINASIEVPGEVKAHTSIGRQILNKDFLKAVTEPLFLVSIGQVLVEPDLSPTDFDKLISGMAVVGQLVCPETLLGLIQSKTKQVIGETVAYPLMNKIVLNSMTLDAVTLQAMADGTELAVVGSLAVLKVLDNELVERKIVRLFVSGNITLHEENLAAFQSKFVKSDQKITLIPVGYSQVEKDLVLDSYLLEALPSRKLYCTGTVVIEANVGAAQLDESIDSLVALGKVFCPAGLRSVLKNKCNLLETSITFYEGLLWQVENERTITPEQLEGLPDKVTILVEGVLTFADNVSTDLLKNKLARMDVMGMVRCTPQQMGVIEVKPGLREGLILDSTRPTDETTSEEGQIGNVNTLTL